jgi:hypothetical protein
VDLPLVFRVLWRFRLVVAAGVVLATALAFASYFRIDPAGEPIISYRQQEGWLSEATLFVHAGDAPIGSVNPSDSDSRIRELTALYLEMARSDEVYALILRDGPIRGKLQSLPVYINGSSEFGSLPMITLAAIAPTPKGARALAARYSEAFKRYIRMQQIQTGTAPPDRVKLDVVRQPRSALLVEPRKRTRPIVVFMTVMMGVIGLVFVLENTRPRVRPIADEAPAPPAAGATSRRTA